MVVEEALRFYSESPSAFMKALYKRSEDGSWMKYGVSEEDSKRIWVDFKGRRFESVLGEIYRVCTSSVEKQLLDQMSGWVATTKEGTAIPPFYVPRYQPDAKPSELISESVNKIGRMSANAMSLVERIQANHANMQARRRRQNGT